MRGRLHREREKNHYIISFQELERLGISRPSEAEWHLLHALCLESTEVGGRGLWQLPSPPEYPSYQAACVAGTRRSKVRS